MLVMCSLTQSFRLQATLSSGASCSGRFEPRVHRVLIMPKRPYEWRLDSHGCYKFNDADSGAWPRDTTAHLPVFLDLLTTNFPDPDSITRSEQARQRRLEREAIKYEHRHSRRKLTQPLDSYCACTAVAGEHSGCRLHVVTVLSGVPHCSDSHTFSTWDPWRR